MAKDNKFKIAIIVDVEGWAYYNNALEIKKNLKDDYDIDIIPIDIFNGNIVKVFVLTEDYDLTHFMWRGAISWLYSEMSRKYIEDLGYTFEEFLQKFVKDRNITTGVYDHLFINSEEERTEFILNNVKDYIVSSEKLKKIYDERYEKKPAMVISDGIDLELFKMENLNKFNKLKGNDKIKIGWTGNSKFTDEMDDDLKGLNKVIMPAIKELNQEGYNIEFFVADRNIKMIPHNEMPKYYNNLDIYLCASRSEGTPGTVLEAMACGIPVISTNVGIVPEVFGNEQKEFIIERTKEDLKDKIKKMIEKEELLNILSKENLQQVQKLSWKKQAKLYKEFFEKII